MLASLYGLSRGGRLPSQRELADFTGLDPIYVSKLVRVLQSGGSGFVDTGVDLKRDRGENRARFLKLVGWGLLALGFLLNLAGLSHFYWG